MATAARSLRLASRSCRNQPIQHVGPKMFVAWKSVGGAIKEAKFDDNEDLANRKATYFDHWEMEMQEHDKKYRGKSPSQILAEVLGSDERAKYMSFLRTMGDKYDQGTKKDVDEAYSSTPSLRRAEKVKKESFWDDEEFDAEMITNDDSEEFDENDMTDIGHAKLEEHREQRAYARTAIWEMPLLSQFAKPFKPPGMTMPLRFRYTSYMGEFHPAEKKVVVEFCANDFGLTKIQEEKLKKLVGPRYNPETEIIRMSCEMFEHQAQNKRYLGDTVQQLVAEAKDPTDDFSDIPLDTRHHKFTPKPKFPLEWRMSEERRKEIQEYRKQAFAIDSRNEKRGNLIDGVAAIQRALNPIEVRKTAPGEVPEMLGLPVRRQGNERPHGPPRF